MDRLVTPYEGSGHRPWDDSAEVPAPLHLHQTPVSSRWVDYNGHMSESCYLRVFGDNSDAFFRYLGIGEDYREGGHSLYTVETHIHNRREVAEGEPLVLSLRLLDHDAKRLHVFHEMRHGETDALLASAEQLLVHVDIARGKSSEMPPELQQRLATIRRSHATLTTPDVVGKPMGIRR
ncbi:thioesterase family protein [Saccharopolyspora dendranthemae]|uniref:Acyl-CoA thioesterase FadM n=1 Tax=Saccharopolyspora dendranthemae TaxID=1181886 RepID=A0A561U7R1_9PSEU|nr:thioesterase family protein [Saccharopolyspora dendranthemae]TWF95405.1 acyl-CoA thioesterase FadM [Saccharopolyspora dendranthemae]